MFFAQVVDSLREIPKLREELANTRAVISKYNGLYETVQQHEKELTEMRAYRAGQHNAADETDKRRTKSWTRFREWGAYLIAAASLGWSLITHTPKL